MRKHIKHVLKIEDLCDTDTPSNMTLMNNIKFQKYKSCKAKKQNDNENENAYEFAKLQSNAERVEQKRMKRFKNKRRHSADQITETEKMEHLIGLENKMMQQAKRIMRSSEIKYTRKFTRESDMQKLKRIQDTKYMKEKLTKRTALNSVMQNVQKKRKTQKEQSIVHNSFISSDCSFSMSRIIQTDDVENEVEIKKIPIKQNFEKTYNCERKKQNWQAFKLIGRQKAKNSKKVLHKKERLKKNEAQRQIERKRKEREKLEGEKILKYDSEGERQKALRVYHSKFKEFTHKYTLSMK